ncbi:MAG: hypothetical protein HWE20_02165 [Gammaproteobacteria bacterium]|nr:hypothetical protein [Gammaproteobacteria bacterium]
MFWISLQELFSLGPFLAIPIFFVCVWVRGRKRGFVGFAMAVFLSAALISAIPILLLLIDEWHLEQEIALLDRDGDGIWSIDEQRSWTEEESKNMAYYIGDGGRKLGVFIMFPQLALIISTVVASLYWLWKLFCPRRIKDG